MFCEGYKLSGYDATYKKTSFRVIEKSESVLEISEVAGGTTFILDLETINDGSKNKVRTWKRNDQQRSQGKHDHEVSISFGSKGLYQKLKYAGKKCKAKEVD